MVLDPLSHVASCSHHAEITCPSILVQAQATWNDVGLCLLWERKCDPLTSKSVAGALFVVLVFCWLVGLGQDRQAERATKRTDLFRSPLQDCAYVFPVMRCAIFNLASMLSICPERLLSPAIQATSHGLKDEWTEGDASLSALSSGPLEPMFTRLD